MFRIMIVFYAVLQFLIVPLITWGISFSFYAIISASQNKSDLAVKRDESQVQA